MRETFVCDQCGEDYDVLVEFDEQTLCEECLNTETLICHSCCERIWNGDNAGDNDTPLCQSCYDHSYTSCENCGRLVHMDNAYYMDDDSDPLCYHCYEQAQRTGGIHDYFYKPEPIFYGDSPRYFGLELEVDDGGERSSAARELMDIANSNHERVYCKHDSSLTDGFEIVTHPMTLDYHCRQMPWEALLKKAVYLGYRSHRTSTCGLHVHVNRDSFGVTEEQQDASIARVLYFFEKHWEELLKFSRRSEQQLNRWASRYGYKDRPKEILDQAKKGYGSGRYTCVNLGNPQTIEFRIFRGTLKYNTLIATLQLLDKVCDVALFMSDDELKGLSWTSFVSDLETPELIQYLKERRLYINEPVAVEEEV